MKKIILILSIFFCAKANAQTYPPYYQNLGSPSTAVEDKGGLFVRGAFVPPQFVDTTAANAAPHTQFYAGSQINTTSDNLYWYRSNDLTQWIKMGSGSGGSGTDSLAFHSITQSSDSTSAKFNRPNGTGTVLKIVYDTTGGGGGSGISKVIGINGVSNVNDSTVQSDSVYQKTLFYNKHSVDSGLVLKLAIADTAGMLSGYNTKINTNTVNIATNTTNIAANTTAISGKEPIQSGTGFVKKSGTTISYVTSPSDSSAYHTSQVLGDTSLVLCDLKGRCDTVNIAAINLWSRNGNSIYYNNGNVGIGKNTPNSRLEIGSAQQSGTVSLDSLGLRLTNISPSTSISVTHLAPPIVQKSNYYFGGSNNSYFFKIAPSGTTGTNYTIYSSPDSITYTAIATFAISSNGGISLLANTSVTGTASVSGASSLNIIYNSNFSTVGSSTLVDTSAILDVVTTKQGFKPPALTKAQRDSMCFSITGVTFTSGTGYITAPAVNAVGGQTIPGTTSPLITATVSGGVITSINITKGGSFFGTPSFSVTGGGGSGTTGYYTMTQKLDPGLQIYCSDCIATDSSTGVNQTWNGSTWKNNW